MTTERDKKEDKAMKTTSNARRAHELLDELDARAELSQEQEKLLRSFLPERPKQKTLEEIAELVNEAWGDTNVNEWDDDALGHLESWLSDLEMQLRGLANTKPAHPEFLETEADYQNAPEGTIVACDDNPPWHKSGSAWFSAVVYGGNSAKSMSGVIRCVLRWGWSE